MSGADRYAVSVAISRLAFPSAAPVVYVANGGGFADALSAGPAAAVQGGPLLLTVTDTLPAAVRAEIIRLDPSRIVVVGGVASVSESVLADLRSIQPNTVRLAGVDRYAASRAVLDYAFDSPESIYIATGENFPDALSAAAAGGSGGSPVLLVPGSMNALDPATSAAVGAADPARLVIVGGSVSVSTGVASGLASLAPTTRISGADRYAVSLALARFAFPHPTEVVLATGLNFPDALAASAWAGRVDAPLITVPPTCVPPAVLGYVEEANVRTIRLVGGPVSLSPAVAALTPCG